MQSGPLRVTIDEEGETRIRRRFVVSTPVAGRVLRIDLEPGDPIKRGGVVARVQPEPPALLDARTRAEAEAAVVAARAALNRSRAEESGARAARDLAQTELRRARELDAAGLTTRQALEMQEAQARTAEEDVRAAAFAGRRSGGGARACAGSSATDHIDIVIRGCRPLGPHRWGCPQALPRKRECGAGG